jgi:3-oxoacyl-[acyl-carrier-protein] synthase II
LKKRIVVTGIGIVSPVGNTREESWTNIQNGISGVDRISLFDSTNFPCQIAAEVKDYDFDKFLTSKKLKKYVSRSTSFALGATNEAIKDSGINERNTDFTRVGTCIGNSGQRPLLSGFKDIVKAFENNFVEMPFMNASDFLKNKYHASSEVVAINNQAKGFVYSLSTACATGTQAIGMACEMIKDSQADVVLAGGCDSMINEIDLMGFCLLGAVTTNFNEEPMLASRPFTKSRSGFVLGEGAATLVLEELNHAVKRGANIYGEIKGYGATMSAYSLTDPPADGSGAYSSMKRALEHANLQAKDIDYINMHGTSTKDNDYTETLSVKKFFGNSFPCIPVSSTKSTTGHLISGAGALEAAICLLAIRDSVLPPTINLTDPDGQCDLDYIPNNKREKKINVAISNSLGFGGSNSSIIMSRFFNEG